jgi:hypothetical protein
MVYDSSQYGLMLKALFKRMFHRKYPVHIMKALELMKYLISSESALNSNMLQQLKEDTRSAQYVRFIFTSFIVFVYH